MNCPKDPLELNIAVKATIHKNIIVAANHGFKINFILISVNDYLKTVLFTGEPVPLA